MKDDVGPLMDADAVRAMLDLQAVTIEETEHEGVAGTAGRLNLRTRQLADAAPVLADPTAFGAALARIGEES
ncbi:MAG: hypothetical protein P1U65_07885 [Minwuia sp.]|nr:hypothetical protein [Minwuia sp.]